MDIFYIILFSLTGTLLLLITVAIGIIVVRNILHGHKLQRKLEQRVFDLRLSQMLKRRGIDIRRYLLRERATTILDHVENCEACKDQDACDKSLQEPTGKDDDFSFCPNEKALRDIANNSRNSHAHRPVSHR